MLKGLTSPLSVAATTEWPGQACYEDQTIPSISRGQCIYLFTYLQIESFCVYPKHPIPKFISYFVASEIKLRALYMLDRYSTNEIYPQVSSLMFKHFNSIAAYVSWVLEGLI